MNPTPIYTEALREAKRRTRKGSPERAALVAMDERTAPEPVGRASGPHLQFHPDLGDLTGSVPPPSPLALDLARARAQELRR